MLHHLLHNELNQPPPTQLDELQLEEIELQPLMSNSSEIELKENQYGPDTNELLHRISNLDCSIKMFGLTLWKPTNIILDISGLHVTNLPDLPSHITHLDCRNTQLTKLPPLPPGLIELVCSNTPLTELPELPSSLIVLSCGKTKITKLSPLPPGLIELVCHKTPLTELPELPSSLELLSCGETKITKLPPLPNNLSQLICYNTLITEIQKLPNNLLIMSICDTKIISLPKLPNTLLILHMSNTKITNIPNIPTSLHTLRCTNTPLQNIPSTTSKKILYMYPSLEEYMMKQNIDDNYLRVYGYDGVMSVFPQHVINLFIENSIQKDGYCPITCEPITNDTACVTNCGHVFSTVFIEKWLLCHTTCPLCHTICRKKYIGLWKD